MSKRNDICTYVLSRMIVHFRLEHHRRSITNARHVETIAESGRNEIRREDYEMRINCTTVNKRNFVIKIRVENIVDILHLIGLAGFYSILIVFCSFFYSYFNNRRFSEAGKLHIWCISPVLLFYPYSQKCEFA